MNLVRKEEAMNSHHWQKHTAHAVLTVKAKTESGLFEQGLHAIYDLIEPVRAANVAPIVNIDLKDNNMEHLWTEFLSNVLTWSMLHKAHYHTFIIHEISHNHVIGVLEGHAANSFKQTLKAVSSKVVHLEHKDRWFNASIEFSW